MCWRWITRIVENVHINPMKATGNHPSKHEIQGQNLIQLAIFQSTNPKATTDEIQAHLLNLQNPANQLSPFSPAQVLRAESLVGLTCKVGSTNCSHAYLPINLTKRNMYFNMTDPFGIAETSIYNMIDVDEAGVKLEHNNKKYRKTPTNICVDDWVYKSDQMTNLLLAITSNDQYIMSWHHIWVGDGTGNNICHFYCFIERIIDLLDHDHLSRSFCFTMDN